MRIGVPGGYLGPDTLDTTLWTVYWARPGHPWELVTSQPWVSRAEAQHVIDVTTATSDAGGGQYVGWYVYEPALPLMRARLFWYRHRGTSDLAPSMVEVPVPWSP